MRARDGQRQPSGMTSKRMAWTGRLAECRSSWVFACAVTFAGCRSSGVSGTSPIDGGLDAGSNGQASNGGASNGGASSGGAVIGGAVSSGGASSGARGAARSAARAGSTKSSRSTASRSRPVADIKERCVVLPPVRHHEWCRPEHDEAAVAGHRHLARSAARKPAGQTWTRRDTEAAWSARRVVRTLRG